MDLNTDVLIIGGGMAGLVAGTIAAESGLNTILLRKGQSATSYSSGAIDVIGYLPDSVAPIISPEEGLQIISNYYPLHPYGILGFNENNSESSVKAVNQVRNAIDWLKIHLNDSSAKLIGDIDENIWPITTLGSTKPTTLVQETMHSTTLTEQMDSSLLFAGIKGLQAFCPSTAAKVFLENQLAMNTPPKKVSHCILDIMPFGKPYNISPIDLARYFDREETIAELVSQLRVYVDTVGATHVALPPVLGIINARENLRAIQDSLDVEGFELLSFPPSVPGLRLQNSLEETFLKSGGRLMLGYEANSATLENHRVVKIDVNAPRRKMSITLKSVVLATGSFIGGGLSGTENGICETVFDLMTVTQGFYSATSSRPSNSTNIFALAPDGHAIFGSGVSVDPEFRPVAKDGVHFAENLFCAGSILAGYSYSVEKSGLGVALATGYTAGQNSVSSMKGVE
jgi:glycerol-3-phosphate dehydrogenase subunit B